jgi:hypothetical protein
VLVNFVPPRAAIAADSPQSYGGAPGHANNGRRAPGGTHDPNARARPAQPF